jgi:hypothetical protein
MHRTVAAALVAALIALGLASCGGSEPTTLNGAALVRRIELACREGQRASAREARSQGRSSGNEGFIAAVLAGQKVTNDKLGEIDTSGAAKADFEAFKEAARRRAELIERIASADRADRERVIRSLQKQIEATTRTLQETSRALRVEGCV